MESVYKNVINNLVTIGKKWSHIEAKEGVGAKVKRIIGIKEVKDLDPFLLLDYFNVKLPGGFPDHPHRGFETITYVQQGYIYHEDFNGHKGKIGPGDVQWMTAGKGIVHAEMPSSFSEPTIGFQLWINLDMKNKMIEPYYQEFKSEDIPIVEEQDGSTVKIIAGLYKNIEGVCRSKVNVSYFDLQIIPDSDQMQFNIEKGMQGFLYVYQGSRLIINDKVELNCNLALSFNSDDDNDSSIITIMNKTNEKCGAILVFGKKLNEPLAKYGTFVMNTQEEIQNAYDDYYEATNGFEKRLEWESEIKNLAEKQ